VKRASLIREKNVQWAEKIYNDVANN